MLVVDRFGGAAAKIWNQLAQTGDGSNQQSWSTRPASFFVQKLQAQCSSRFAMAGQAVRRDEQLTNILSKRNQVLHAAAAFALLMGALFLGIDGALPAQTFAVVMFAGLISAGATGALVRVLLGKTLDADPRTSLFLGAVAGFVVGLAYLIPQWVGAPGVLKAGVKEITDKDRIQFVSVLLVAISAGVGFDTVFNRLQKQAESIAVSPPTRI